MEEIAESDRAAAAAKGNGRSNGHAPRVNGTNGSAANGSASWFAEVLETIDVMVPLELSGGVPVVEEPGQPLVTRGPTLLSRQHPD